MVAGATGNLGGKVIESLIAKGATVGALVRNESNHDTIMNLKAKGVNIYKVNMTDKSEIAKNLINVDCVVSALAGLKEVILDTQKDLLDASILAGVPRFIPSDFQWILLLPGT